MLFHMLIFYYLYPNPNISFNLWFLQLRASIYQKWQRARWCETSMEAFMSMLTFTRLRRPAERGMDPHNARRPEQIIVADRERAAGYATGTCLSICGPDCDDHRCGICLPYVMDFRGRAKTDWRRDAARQWDRLPVYEPIKLIVESSLRLRNLRATTFVSFIEGTLMGAKHTRYTLPRFSSFELSLNQYLNLSWNCVYFKYQQAYVGILPYYYYVTRAFIRMSLMLSRYRKHWDFF